MKRLVALVILMFALSGCGDTTAGEWADFHYIDGPNGKKIPCVLSSHGSVHCDWSHFQ